MQKKPSKTITGEKRNKYEYDSDEEAEGGTWEHKARMQEMTESSRELLPVLNLGKHNWVSECYIVCASLSLS